MKNPTAQLKIKETAPNKFDIKFEFDKNERVWFILNGVEQIHNTIFNDLQEYAKENPNYKFATIEDIELWKYEKKKTQPI